MTPEDLTGHWRRAWLKTEAGTDTQTEVHWLQAPSGYVDLRFPEVPPLKGALARQDAGTLAALLRAEGFAGTIALNGAICTWTRRINLAGRPDRPDIGQLSWQGGALLEEGEGYRELWVRQPDAVTERRIFRWEGQEAHLVWGPEIWALGLGDPAAPPVPPLPDLAPDAPLPTGLATRFEAHQSGLYALGTWQEGRAVTLRATHPLFSASPFAQSALDAGRLLLSLPRFDGSRADTLWAA